MSVHGTHMVTTNLGRYLLLHHVTALLGLSKKGVVKRKRTANGDGRDEEGRDISKLEGDETMYIQIF